MPDAPQKLLSSPIPANETERLAALHRYKILDTPPEAAFDRITALAARLFQVPTVLISLVDETRAWFKACVGFEASEVPRDATLCSFAVLTDELLIVPDARLDDRFACNPFVQREPGLRFYAGAPLLNRDGFNLGTLCLLDRQPRDSLTTEQEDTLVDLAAMVVDELELRSAVQQIAQSEEKYRTLFESIDEGFCLCKMLFDPQGQPRDYQFLEVNPAFAQLTGLEDAIGKTARQLVPNLEDHWIEIYGKVVRTGEPVRFEQQSIALNRWFDVNAFCVGEPQSHQLGILFRNITDRVRAEDERKRAEKALLQANETLQTAFEELQVAEEELRQQNDELAATRRQAEAERYRYQDLFNFAPDGYVVTDAYGVIQEANQTFVALVAVDQSFVANTLLLNYLSELDRRPLRNWLSTLQQPSGGQRLQTDQLTLLSVSGQVIPVAVTGAAVRNAQGRVVGVRWLIQDITERKQAEIALQQSEEKSRQILDSISDAFCALDENWQFTYVNRAAEEMLDRAPGDLLGKNIWEEYPGLEGSGFQQLYHRVAADRVAESLTAFYPDHDRWYEVRTYPAANGITIYFRNITDRIQAEAALRESEARFRTLTAAIPQLIWTATSDGSVDYLSDQWADYIGLPPEQLHGWSWQQTIHPDDLPHTLRKWEISLQSGEVVDLRHRYRYRTGEWRWNLVRGVPVKNEAGQVVKWFGTCTDIHESTLRERDTQFLSDFSEVIRTIDTADALVTAATEMIGQYLQVKRCYFTQTDETRDRCWIARDYHASLPSIVGEYRISDYPPAILDLLRSGHLSFSNDTKLDPRTIDYYAAAYAPLEIRAYVAVPFHTDGRWTGNLIAATDEPRPWQEREINLLETAAERAWFAAEKLRSDAALRQSEARYRLLAEAIPQFVWITNTVGQNEYVNQRFCDYTGLTLEKLADLGWLAIVHPDDQERTRQCWLAAVRSGQHYEIEYRFRRADGAYRWFLGQGIPLKDEQGRILRWFGTCTDIEPQKQLEQARLRLLEQEQAARENAEQANRIKDEFLAVLSHELRTPMNPIVGWSKLLRSGKLDGSKTAQAIETIDRNAQLQVQLIDDLLDISRILRGKLSLDRGPVNLGSVVAAALETVRLAAEAKLITIQSLFPPSTPIVNGDAGRLQQVVWNLLSNAVKFTPNAGRIEVELSQVGANAQIQVRDTGKGIKPDFLPYVFEHFRQEDGAITRKFGGLGLGLAIARQIVEMHGGRISVESPGDGQGATFTVELPVLGKREAGRGNQQQEGGKRGTQSDTLLPSLSEPLAGLQILVVDDEPDSRNFVAFVLEQAGAIVTCAASGMEAVRQIEQSTFSLIISDVGMPKMDGYQLLQQVRLLEQGQPVPAIALTAYAGDFDRQQALQAGFQRHIPKPVEPERLIEVIVSLLGNQP